MTTSNATLLTHTPNSATVATLTMAVEHPQLNLLDSVVILRGIERGKQAVITGSCLMVEPVCCYWIYFLHGEGVQSSCSHAEYDLQMVEVGKPRKPRIKRPEFKLFDQVTLETGEAGFICGVDLVNSGKAAHWQYNIIGVGISQSDYFCADELQQLSQQQAA